MEQRTEEVEPPYSFVLCYRQLSVLKEGEHGSGWLRMSASADVKAAAASTATAENIDRDQCVRKSTSMSHRTFLIKRRRQKM